jgi:hypothetical protein
MVNVETGGLRPSISVSPASPNMSELGKRYNTADVKRYRELQSIISHGDDPTYMDDEDLTRSWLKALLSGLFASSWGNGYQALHDDEEHFPLQAGEQSDALENPLDSQDVELEMVRYVLQRRLLLESGTLFNV